ncbi:hypothetical protein WA158_004991 [Blastocystis sp. Blastoise]
MKFWFVTLLFLCVNSALCGRYSDNCSTLPGQDIDYVFYTNALGSVYKIEMQNVEPADKSCGENHNYGLIWTYINIETIETGNYKAYASDVAFITYNLTSTSNINCGVPIETGVQYSLQNHTCLWYSSNVWDGLTDYVNKDVTLKFDIDENGKLHFNRGTYVYVNTDGCFYGVNDNTQIIIIIVAVFVVVLLLLFLVYLRFIRRSVKTIAGEKTKLYKQNKKQLQTKKVGSLKRGDSNKKDKSEPHHHSKKDINSETNQPKVIHV